MNNIFDLSVMVLIEDSYYQYSYIYNEELKDLVYIQGSKEFSVVDSEGEKHKLITEFTDEDVIEILVDSGIAEPIEITTYNDTTGEYTDSIICGNNNELYVF